MNALDAVRPPCSLRELVPFVPGNVRRPTETGKAGRTAVSTRPDGIEIASLGRSATEDPPPGEPSVNRAHYPAVRFGQ
jgi:hypothetical protein